MELEVRPLLSGCDTLHEQYSTLYEDVETVIEAHLNSDIHSHGKTNTVMGEEQECETVTRKSYKALHQQGNLSYA